MRQSGRIWLIAGAVLVLAIFVVLAALVGRESASNQAELPAPGETQVLRARVVEILEEGMVEQGDFSQPFQHLKLRITSGALTGQEVSVEYGLFTVTNQDRLFEVGDRVLVDHTRTLDGQDVFAVTELVRTGPLLWLSLIFVGATILLSGWQGMRSVIGMGVSLLVIVGFIVPQILQGRNPILVAVLGSVVMMGISLYLVYGWKGKTHVAVIGLFTSLVLTGLLAVWFVNWTRLSGFGAEEAAFLQAAGVQLDTRGLLLAGIIIGTLGALDDIAIGQSSAIFELSTANPLLEWQALFKHGMAIGRDHIAAMVNTLLLAYVGAALPLVLLFSVYTEPLGITVNRAIIAEEIVRTLVGSLGLLAGVPVTSLIAALAARRRTNRNTKPE
jgi:uncharacterized membrane protein